MYRHTQMLRGQDFIFCKIQILQKQHALCQGTIMSTAGEFQINNCLCNSKLFSLKSLSYRLLEHHHWVHQKTNEGLFLLSFKMHTLVQYSCLSTIQFQTKQIKTIFL